ncbi:MAG: hypothetical protein ACRDWD_04885 [Acidimicrobiia bacterium]
MSAIADATAELGDAGWQVTIAIDPEQYQAFREALTTTAAALVAVVADDAVLLAFEPGLPALQSVIGPELTEDQARAVAAALLVEQPLPIELDAPAKPDVDGPAIGDFWTAAMGVYVCGTWLPNAPNTSADLAVHSHADGLVYVHPDAHGETGARATLGAFMRGGGWSISEEHLSVWDTSEHRNGDRCADGQAAMLKWWVDGAEQRGDPSEWPVANGQVITLAFDADEQDPGLPPQADALHLPALRASSE